MTKPFHLYITGASNPLSLDGQVKLKETLTFFNSLGLGEERDPLPTPPLPGGENKISRARSIQDFLKCREPSLAADPTGGDLSNTLLPLLFPIEGPPHRRLPEREYWKKAYWSMSDNTTLLNAFLDRGLCRSFHGHCLTLVGKDAEGQKKRFKQILEVLSAGQPFPGELIPPLEPLGKDFPDGPLIGGNLRALGKLLGTPYAPDFRGKILLLESLALGDLETASLLAQLDQAGGFSQAAGVVIGRFTAFEKTVGRERVLQVLQDQLPGKIPKASCPLLGHGSSGWTVPLGEPLHWRFGPI